MARLSASVCDSAVLEQHPVLPPRGYPILTAQVTESDAPRRPWDFRRAVGRIADKCPTLLAAVRAHVSFVPMAMSAAPSTLTATPVGRIPTSEPLPATSRWARLIH